MVDLGPFVSCGRVFYHKNYVDNCVVDESSSPICTPICAISRFSSFNIQGIKFLSYRKKNGNPFIEMIQSVFAPRFSLISNRTAWGTDTHTYTYVYICQVAAGDPGIFYTGKSLI